MLVKDLIKEISKLPESATIGTIDINDARIFNSVAIVSNKHKIYDCLGDEVTIERIEKCRHSNKSKICDFYIV